MEEIHNLESLPTGLHGVASYLLILLEASVVVGHPGFVQLLRRVWKVDWYKNR